MIIPDNIIIQINTSAMASGDIGTCREVVEKVLLESSEAARGHFQTVLFWFPDYDDDPRELYEIPDTRKWFQKVDEAFPYFIYFLAPEQFYLYIASQKNVEGTGLTHQALLSYIAGHEGAIEHLCEDIGDDFETVSTRIGSAVKQMITYKA